MAKLASFSRILFLTLSYGCLILSPECLRPSVAVSQSSYVKKTSKCKRKYCPPALPPNTRRVLNSNSNRGAGSQGGCGRADSSLVSLIPESIVGKERYVWSSTRKTNPSLLFYVNYPTDSVVTFILQDSSGREIDRVSSTVKKEKEIINLTVSQKLKDGESYHWYLGVKCDSRSDDNDDFVEGGLYKQKSDLKITSQSLQQSILDAEEGLWVDSLDTLSRLRFREPDSVEINKIWNELLVEGKLSDIAEEKGLQFINSQP
jgi:hypothetical protein